MQQAGYLYDEGYIKEYYRGEEEIGVMSAVGGASRAGVRALTATAGPGLMRGMEAISSWPGARTPLVLMNMCRVINTPLAIRPGNNQKSPAGFRHGRAEYRCSAGRKFQYCRAEWREEC